MQYVPTESGKERYGFGEHSFAVPFPFLFRGTAREQHYRAIRDGTMPNPKGKQPLKLPSPVQLAVLVLLLTTLGMLQENLLKCSS